MSSSAITRISLPSHVRGGFVKLADFKIEQVAPPSKDQLSDNQVLLRPIYYSIDPYQRGRIAGVKGSFIESYSEGSTITNILVATVVASTSADYREGDLVIDNDGKWETEYTTDARAISKAPVQYSAEPRDHVGVLGMAAYSAYVGAVVLAKPKAGETILVSSASGGVGQMVVQLAKARGLRVVGVAGSEEKVEYAKSIGADVAFNYKTCGNYMEAIKAAAPEGIDIWFDNVGGEFLDAALANINTHARIIICGAITQYNLSSPDERYGVKCLTSVLIKKATIHGFIIDEYYDTPTHTAFYEEVSRLYREGRLTYRLCETEGLENAPQAFLDLFTGKNFGRSIVKA
ncbi:hypothetical protein IW152_005589 [Coemansia sp. BCRC 34962]|nr:hypothetical protein IW152_005589 [Coemansia sp. BCRC 34962]